MTVYINDLFLFAVNLKKIDWLKKQLLDEFKIKNLSKIYHYLNIKVVRDK